MNHKVPDTEWEKILYSKPYFDLIKREVNQTYMGIPIVNLMGVEIHQAISNRNENIMEYNHKRLKNIRLDEILAREIQNIGGKISKKAKETNGKSFIEKYHSFCENVRESVLFLPSNDRQLKVMLCVADHVKSFTTPIFFLEKKKEYLNVKGLNDYKHYYYLKGNLNTERKDRVRVVRFLRDIIDLFDKKDEPIIKSRLLGKFSKLKQKTAKRMKFIRKISKLLRATKPKVTVSGRPKRDIPLGVVLASQACNIRNHFLSHTIWGKKRGKRLPFYDLSIFDTAYVMTRSCKRDIRRFNEMTEVVVSGWPGLEFSNDKWEESVAAKKRIDILHLATTGYPKIPHIIRALDGLNIQLTIKGHPPGWDLDKFKEKKISAQNLEVDAYAHNQTDLHQEISNADLIITGVSNTAFEAMYLNRPVVGFFHADFEHEKSNTQSVSLSDFPKSIAYTPGSLRKRIQNFVRNPEKLVEYKGKQQKYFKEEFDVMSDECPEKTISDHIRTKIGEDKF